MQISTAQEHISIGAFEPDSCSSRPTATQNFSKSPPKLESGSGSSTTSLWETSGPARKGRSWTNSSGFSHHAIPKHIFHHKTTNGQSPAGCMEEKKVQPRKQKNRHFLLRHTGHCWLSIVHLSRFDPPVFCRKNKQNWECAALQEGLYSIKSY